MDEVVSNCYASFTSRLSYNCNCNLIVYLICNVVHVVPVMLFM